METTLGLGSLADLGSNFGTVTLGAGQLYIIFFIYKIGVVIPNLPVSTSQGVED